MRLTINNPNKLILHNQQTNNKRFTVYIQPPILLVTPHAYQWKEIYHGKSMSWLNISIGRQPRYHPSRKPVYLISIANISPGSIPHTSYLVAENITIDFIKLVADACIQ